MKLEKLCPYVKDTILQSYRVRDCREAVRIADSIFRGEPFYGIWRVVRENDTKASFRDVALAVEEGNLSQIEWEPV